MNNEIKKLVREWQVSAPAAANAELPEELTPMLLLNAALIVEGREFAATVSADKRASIAEKLGRCAEQLRRPTATSAAALELGQPTGELARFIVEDANATMREQAETMLAQQARIQELEAALQASAAATPQDTDSLRTECETLRHGLRQADRRISELEAARMAYASEFPLNTDGEPDVGNIHANIRKLKAAATPQDYRAQGREEALAIILAQDAEEPFSKCTRSSAIADTGDYSTSWDEDKLRELLHIGDRTHDAFGRAEAAYWEAQGHKDDAERAMRMAERAPYFKRLHDVLAKHQEWDLLHDLQAAATPALDEPCRAALKRLLDSDEAIAKAADKELQEAVNNVALPAVLREQAAAVLQARAALSHQAQRDSDLQRKYFELLFAVSLVHPGETRHETALRYIRQAEAPSDNAAMQSASKEG